MKSIAIISFLVGIGCIGLALVLVNNSKNVTEIINTMGNTFSEAMEKLSETP